MSDDDIAQNIATIGFVRDLAWGLQISPLDAAKLVIARVGPPSQFSYPVKERAYRYIRLAQTVAKEMMPDVIPAKPDYDLWATG